MALINRVSRLFRADFNAVLDQIEEPALLLRQSIRDMDDEIATAEEGIAALEQQQVGLARRIADLKVAIVDFDEQLDLCFESGNEALARSQIRRKLETGKLLAHCEQARTANDQALAERRRQVDTNRDTLEGLRQKAEVFGQQEIGRDADGDGSGSPWNAQAFSVHEDEVEIAFLREQSQRAPS